MNVQGAARIWFVSAARLSMPSGTASWPMGKIREYGVAVVILTMGALPALSAPVCECMFRCADGADILIEVQTAGLGMKDEQGSNRPARWSRNGTRDIGDDWIMNPFVSVGGEGLEHWDPPSRVVRSTICANVSPKQDCRASGAQEPTG